MRKKRKKKINYERKIILYLQKNFHIWQIPAWLYTPNPILGMSRPYDWIKVGLSKKLWEYIKVYEKSILDHLTSK